MAHKNEVKKTMKGGSGRNFQFAVQWKYFKWNVLDGC